LGLSQYVFVQCCTNALEFARYLLKVGNRCDFRNLG
jgi:hypothetical protein